MALSILDDEYWAINDLQIRIEALEEKVFKKKAGITATKSQKMLLLKELRILDLINELNISLSKKAELLSILLGASSDNIEKSFRLRDLPIGQNDLENETNLKFALDVTTQLGLTEISKRLKKKLEKAEILNRQKSKK